MTVPELQRWNYARKQLLFSLVDDHGRAVDSAEVLGMAKPLDAFGRALRAARKAAGLSQADLGSKVGVTASAVGNWERGEDEPERERVVQIERALELTPGALATNLGWTPVGSADTTDYNSRIPRLSPEARRAIDAIIDAEERALGT